MRILIADDERELADALTSHIHERRHEVVATVTTGGLDVIHAYDQFHPDLVIMDIMMPKFNGLSVCQALLAKNPEARVVLVSGKLNPDNPFIANTGAVGFLSKPADLSKLDEILATVVASLPAAA